jgi:hypothetical protein
MAYTKAWCEVPSNATCNNQKADNCMQQPVWPETPESCEQVAHSGVWPECPHLRAGRAFAAAAGTGHAPLAQPTNLKKSHMSDIQNHCWPGIQQRLLTRRHSTTASLERLTEYKHNAMSAADSMTAIRVWWPDNARRGYAQQRASERVLLNPTLQGRQRACVSPNKFKAAGTMAGMIRTGSAAASRHNKHAMQPPPSSLALPRSSSQS